MSPHLIFFFFYVNDLSNLYQEYMSILPDNSRTSPKIRILAGKEFFGAAKLQILDEGAVRDRS